MTEPSTLMCGTISFAAAERWYALTCWNLADMLTKVVMVEKLKSYSAFVGLQA